LTYALSLLASARRDLEYRLPERVAAAAWEFIRGPLLEDPHKVGKPLRNEPQGLWSARRGQYRVIYRILDDVVVVEVVRVAHRADIYH
jgi:mRNA-degrading endonuclease RelE of RelBE toxin-antitoxin system